MALFGLVKMGEEGVTISFREFLGNKYAMMGLGVAGGMIGGAIIPVQITNMLRVTGKIAVAVRFITNLLLGGISYIISVRTPEEGGLNTFVKYTSFGASLGFVGFAIADTIQELMKAEPVKKAVATIRGWVTPTPIPQEITPTYISPEVTVTEVPAEVTVSPEEYVSPTVTAGVEGSLRSTIE